MSCSSLWFYGFKQFENELGYLCGAVDSDCWRRVVQSKQKLEDWILKGVGKYAEMGSWY